MQNAVILNNLCLWFNNSGAALLINSLCLRDLNGIYLKPTNVKRIKWLLIIASGNTIECHYNAVQYNMILHTSLWWLRQNINESVNPHMTPHSSPWWASYGVSFVTNLEKIDHIIMAPYCSLPSVQQPAITWTNDINSFWVPMELLVLGYPSLFTTSSTK